MPLDLVRVESVRRAAEALAADPSARFLAGGTILMRLANANAGALQRLILSDGLGLDQIAISAGRATLGASVTMADLAAHPDLAFLAPVAESIGGPAVRNMATIGGNLFARSPYGDVAVALLALAAGVSVERTKGSEDVSLEALLADRGRQGPQIVTGIAFDLPPDGAFRFIKAIRRRPHGAAVLSIAAVLPVVAGKLANVRVAYGAMAPTPIRARAVEQALEGRVLDEAAVADAARVAADGTMPESDAFASDWYRRNVIAVHLRRLLAPQPA